MSPLINKLSTLNNKEDFIEFVQLLIADFKRNPQEWENKSLESYLEAIASWTADMDGYYLNNNQPVPQGVNWKVFANILMAAKMYE